jgi:hypothetical protein
MGQDEIQSQQQRHDVAPLVFSSGSKVILANHGVDLTAIQMTEMAIASLSLNRGIAQRPQLRDE